MMPGKGAEQRSVSNNAFTGLDIFLNAGRDNHLDGRLHILAVARGTILWQHTDVLLQVEYGRALLPILVGCLTIIRRSVKSLYPGPAFQ